MTKPPDFYRTDYRSSALERLFRPSLPSPEFEAAVRRIVREELGVLLNGPQSSLLTGRRPTIAACIDLAADAFGVDRALIIGPRKTPDAFCARAAAMWLAHRATGKSYPVIGRAFGRDHSTAMNAIKRAREFYAEDQDFADRAKAMFDALQVRM